MKIDVSFRLTTFTLIIILSEPCLSQYFDPPEILNETILIPRVVNGFPAKLGDVPYQIGFKQLVSRSTGLCRTYCGGVIIGRNKILSAAHCFQSRKSACFSRSIYVGGKELNRKYAVAGTLRNSEIMPRRENPDGPQWRSLKLVIYPAKYKFPRDDICIVFTRRPFNFNSYVNAIPYASRYRDYKGECLLSGYGRITPAFSKIKQSSDKLLLANLAVIPNYYCSKMHKRNMRKFICTSDRVSDSAQGDSGGPLVCSQTGDPNEKDRGILVGIVSGSRKYSGSFFTRVSAYHNYIRRENSGSLSAMSFSSILYSLLGILYYGFYLFCCCFIFSFRW